MKAAKQEAPGRRLLIVEDDILPAMALKDEFEDAGYDVMDLTGRVQEALSAVNGCKPDFALVNIELQGRDDGIGLAGELTALGVPVLFISGQVSRARSARTAAVGSLPKPYRPSDVVDSVEYLLRHLKGDESVPPPPGLEVFDGPEGTTLPDAA